MKKLLFTFIVLASALAGHSKTMIISDIDDTIKKSHILGSKFSALRMSKKFTGLSDLYNSFICHKENSSEAQKYCRQNRGIVHSADRWVTYVTGAPRRLQLLGREFLSLTSFPAGVVKGKSSFFGSTHDFKKLEIINLLTNIDMDT